VLELELFIAVPMYAVVFSSEKSTDVMPDGGSVVSVKWWKSSVASPTGMM
jgi:hypothetical protein